MKTFAVYGDHLELGANMTLAETIKFFRKISTQNPLLYGYTGVLADHIELVANVPVRNVWLMCNTFCNMIFFLFFLSRIHIELLQILDINFSTVVLFLKVLSSKKSSLCIFELQFQPNSKGLGQVQSYIRSYF